MSALKERAIALLNNGLQPEAISEQLGITLNTAKQYIKGHVPKKPRSTLKSRIVELKKAGMPVVEIAEKLGVVRSTVTKCVAEAGLSETPARKAQILKTRMEVARLREQGLTIQQIAERLGTSYTCVQTHCRTLGIKSRKTREHARELIREMIRMRENGMPTREIAEKVGVPYNTVRVYLWQRGYKSRHYSWIHIRIKREDALILKAAGEVRGTTMEDIARRLLLVAVKDKLVDSILDDQEEFNDT